MNLKPFFVACAAVGLLLAGCGISAPTRIIDAGDGDGGTSDAGSRDAGAPQADAGPPVDAGNVCASPHACADATNVPMGWTPVIFSTTSALCPTGFGSGRSALGDPLLGAGACACRATDETAPSCSSGFIDIRFGASCGSRGGPFIVNGGCNAISAGNSVPNTLSAPTIAPSGGSCTATLTKVPSQLTSTSAMTCLPTTCPEAVCAGAVPSGYAACIETTGNTACPSGSLFSTQHLVGDAAILLCTPCGGCTVSTTCTASSFSLYSDTGCSTPALVTVPADGVCRATTNSGSGFLAVKYTASVSATYDAGASEASAMLTNLRTVCCR